MACHPVGSRTIELPPYHPGIWQEDVNVILRGSWTEDGVRLWWGRPRPQLGGRTPLEAWMQGDKKLVYDLAVGGIMGGGT